MTGGAGTRLLSAGLLLVCAATAAGAQEPIQPDRPDVTNGTHLVDTGLLQIEVGGLYTHAAARQHAFGTPVTARIGVTDWVEARIGTDGLLTQQDGVGHATGIGNTQLGAKLRLWPEPDHEPLVSILAAVNLPTASADKGLGSGSADYTATVLTGTDLGPHAHVDVNYGIGAIGAGPAAPHFLQHLLSVSTSVATSDSWNPYVEVFWFSRQAADGGAITAIDAGAIHTIGTRYAVDGGLQVGVSHQAPALAAFGGVSLVVGSVASARGAHGPQHRHEPPVVHELDHILPTR